MAKNDKAFPPNVYLRDARLARGWSQQELADKVGTVPNTVSRWELGTTSPGPYFRQQLCKVFDKTSAELGLVPPPSHGFRISNVPVTSNPYFTGREQLLAALYERLSIARTAALTQAQALFGLGGIGKTQTAAEYTLRYGNEYAHIFWVRAATHETLVADFVKLAELLELLEKEEQDQQRVVALVQRWLATHDDWLLILDNADDLLLAQEFLPRSHKGYVLFTTRAQAAGPIAASVEVEQLSMQEGTLLLLRWIKLLDVESSLEQAQAGDRAAAERIVEEMGGLPLAIVQAGAYIEETGCSLTDYSRLYATHRKDLLARRGSFLLDYPDTVATTWLLSFRQIEQASPAAADLLRLCAFLAPDAIPEELLIRGAAELGAVPGAVASDEYKLNEALEALRKYSLVRRSSSTHILSIHRLVQAVLRESMDQETQRVWAERTVRAVNAAFPETDYGTGANRQYYLQYYLPHVQECATLIDQYHLYSPEAAQMLYQAGMFLYFHGLHPQSQALHRQALVIRQQALGSEHPDVAESLNILAMFSRLQGDYEQAESFHRQALAIREKTLGLEHLTTAFSLNNLGILYCTLGKFEQAEPLLQRALIIRERSLGSEHPETLLIILNLAKLYVEQRKYNQAEQLLLQALSTSERVLEPGHPLIAHNLNLLARLSYEQRNYERAETLWKRSLVILEEALGSEHPASAGVFNDLANLHSAQGSYAQAQSLCQRALDICEKILGPDHPDTVTYREHLARIVSKKEAEQDGGHHSASS